MDPYYEPEFESLKELLLDMAQERSTDILLKMIVDTLVERPHVAMASIRLTRPGDACHACPMVSERPDQSSCFHLEAIEKKKPHEASSWKRAS